MEKTILVRNIIFLFYVVLAELLRHRKRASVTDKKTRKQNGEEEEEVVMLWEKGNLWWLQIFSFCLAAVLCSDFLRKLKLSSFNNDFALKFLFLNNVIVLIIYLFGSLHSENTFEILAEFKKQTCCSKPLFVVLKSWLW